jgi:hypothetical protein
MLFWLPIDKVMVWSNQVKLKMFPVIAMPKNLLFLMTISTCMELKAYLRRSKFKSLIYYLFSRMPLAVIDDTEILINLYFIFENVGFDVEFTRAIFGYTVLNSYKFQQY